MKYSRNTAAPNTHDSRFQRAPILNINERVENTGNNSVLPKTFYASDLQEDSNQTNGNAEGLIRFQNDIDQNGYNTYQSSIEKS